MLSQAQIKDYQCNPEAVAILLGLFEIRATKPELSAIEVFDAAMTPYAGKSPEFGFAFLIDDRLTELLNIAFPLKNSMGLGPHEKPDDCPEIDWGESMEFAVDARLNDLYGRYQFVDSAGIPYVA